MPKSTLLTVKCCLCRNQPGFNKVEKPMAVALCSSGDKPGMLGVQVHRQGRLLLPEGAGEPPFLQHPSSRRHKQIATQINKGVSGRDTEQHPCCFFYKSLFSPCLSFYPATPVDDGEQGERQLGLPVTTATARGLSAAPGFPSS